ncbi:MAG: hypothetical protein ABWJ42_02415 [Sulfolobales archaeon]
MIRRDIRSFYIWIRSSQIPLYIAPIYILLGMLILGSKPGLHQYLMIFAVRLFYVGVMWGQVPGFSAMMPHPILSLLVGSMEVLAAILAVVEPRSLLWQLFLWIGSIAHVAQYMPKGLGRTMRTAPNIIVVIGLLLSLTTPLSGLLGVLAFPIASVLSLLIRVDPNMRKSRITPGLVILYTAIFAVSWIIGLLSIYRDLILLPLTILILFIPKIGGRDIYRLGTTLSKIVGLLTFPLSLIFSWDAVFHLAMIGFLALTMISLCTPLLIPGIIWREIPKLSSIEILLLVVAMLLSALLRFLSPILAIHMLSMTSGLLVIFVTLYYLYKILKMPSVPVKL